MQITCHDPWKLEEDEIQVTKSSFLPTIGKEEKEVLPLGQMPPWLLGLGEPT